MKDGQVVGIEGGRDAKELSRVIEGVPNVRVVAEFAFGTSDKSPLGSPSEKGRIGNVHFAMGDNKNAYPGGQNSSPLHLDGVVRNATLEIEGTPAATSSATGSGTSDRRGLRPVSDHSGVRVVPLADVPPIDLPGGSWSRVILTGDRVGSGTALGVSSFAPGTSTAMLSHETEELAYVLSGQGELRLDDEVVPVWTAVGALHPGRGLACGRQHGRRAGEHGLRVPASRLSADRASMSDRAPMSDELRPRHRGRLPGHRARGLRRPHARSRQRARARLARRLDQAQGTRPRRGRARRRHRARPRRPRRARALPTTTSSRSCTPRSIVPGRT